MGTIGIGRLTALAVGAVLAMMLVFAASPERAHAHGGDEGGEDPMFDVSAAGVGMALVGVPTLLIFGVGDAIHAAQGNHFPSGYSITQMLFAGLDLYISSAIIAEQLEGDDQRWLGAGIVCAALSATLIGVAIWQLATPVEEIALDPNTPLPPPTVW